MCGLAGHGWRNNLHTSSVEGRSGSSWMGVELYVYGGNFLKTLVCTRNPPIHLVDRHVKVTGTPRYAG